MDKIILLGYMGSGKTTIAELLAQKAGLPFKDLDTIIEQTEKSSIKAIFENKGEVYFRKTEHHLFKELLQNRESFVLSLGGGTPCYARNHELLKVEGITSVYLKASIDELCDRLQQDKTNRPLIAKMDPGEMKEFIAKHLFERSFFYNQASHIITVDGKSPDAIVAEIGNLLA